MFFSNTCRFVVCFLSLSVSATTETVRGVHREPTYTVDVALGTAGYYVILAKTGISTVPTSGHREPYEIQDTSKFGKSQNHFHKRQKWFA
jgi:hypothetical protein